MSHLEVLKRIWQQKRDIERVAPQGYFTNETKEEIETLTFAINLIEKVQDNIGLHNAICKDANVMDCEEADKIANCVKQYLLGKEE